MGERMNDEPGSVHPVVGALGQDTETHERHRLQTILDRSPVPVRATQPPEAARDQGLAQKAVSVVLRQEMGAVREAVREIANEIRSNTEALRMADIPLEQVANSHERATSSFERLRAEGMYNHQQLERRIEGIETLLKALLAEVKNGRKPDDPAATNAR